MSELISRQDVIQLIQHKTWLTTATKSQLIAGITQLPSADPGLDEWCTDCKEYDHEKHCCPRWNRVIRETLADMKTQKTGRWIWQGFNIECSECGAMPDFDSTEPLYRFCPNCGARMDDGKENGEV